MAAFGRISLLSDSQIDTLWAMRLLYLNIPIKNRCQELYTVSQIRSSS